MEFNVTAPGQKITVYEGTVRLDVTINKATGVKSHIINTDKNTTETTLTERSIYRGYTGSIRALVQSRQLWPIGLFCQSTGQRPCCFVLYNHLL